MIDLSGLSKGNYKSVIRLQVNYGFTILKIAVRLLGSQTHTVSNDEHHV